jgi:rSAM/selenodomain-associated transferase 1
MRDMSSVLIMARAPRPGHAKTRLEPLLGPDGCARLQSALVGHTAAWASTTARRAWLAYTPGDARDELSKLVPASTAMFAQRDGDLGVRLAHAAQRAHGRGSLVVIGTDAPHLGSGHVREARRALRGGHDACLVPALDGGYALIALARPAPEAFRLPSDAWGGPDVLELTRRALHRARLSYMLLDPVADLDTPEDALALRRDPRCPAAIRDALTCEEHAA